MALTTCKECGGKMSDRATECPHCGCPREFQGEIQPKDNSSTQSQEPLSEQIQPNPKKTHKGLWISIAAILVIALCAGAFLLFGGTSTLKITPELTKALQRYDQIDAFSEGMAAVRRDGKWGYINLQGEEVIPCQFSDEFPVGQFSEGLACVVDDRSEKDKKLWNKRVGFINKKGEFVITGDYFTEAPAGAVWEDESHKLPSFKDGKCAVWNTAVFSLEGEGTESGWSKEYESNKIVLIDSKGKISQAHDSLAYQLANYHPYVIPTPYKDVLTPIETKVAFDDYAVNIARDTVECDNGAKLVTWQIIDANSYPYGMYGGTYEKTCQYYIDQYGNSTLTPEQEKSMEQHLNGLMASLLEKHNEQLRREAEEERIRQEEEERKRVEWIYGTWEYSMVVDMGRYLGGRKQMNSKMIISEDNLTSYTNGKLDYNGGYTIENGAIIYDRHNGYCSSLPLDFTNKRIEADRNGKYFTKVSSSYSNGYPSTSYSTSANASSYTTFRTEADVWAYLSSTVYYGRGTHFRITQRYLEVNGSPQTGGVRVVNFNGSRATLQTSDPYSGGQILTLYINAANGSVSSGGEVYYAK
ncbi:WG repeat-containing protein [uncultured Duncaniella sp.]|jgi:hypothetical protein|uniref:WG repeat-containing protein n=2 Tax=uncultured Duncaniella sp. TaxID=2768039 RepID=UPI00273037D2|nr:WG repeat-containing protein [uncultured Duncaniella sp.]